MDKTLTIVIPAYNESKRILKTLLSIDQYISSEKKIFQVLIVNDGSVDGTGELVKLWINNDCTNKRNFNLIGYLPNRGKGYAIREGFLKAETDLIAFTDADGSIPIGEVNKLVYWINNGYDVVCGSKVIKDDSTSVKWAFFRRFSAYALHLILKLLNLAVVNDTQCGFKVFTKDVAKLLASKQKCFDFSFDIEYLFLSKKYGCKIKEVPVNSSHIKGSKVNLLVDSIKILFNIFKVKYINKYD